MNPTIKSALKIASIIPTLLVAGIIVYMGVSIIAGIEIPDLSIGGI